MIPKRIQLSRAKNWRKPAGAVVVSRPSKWGNPYKIGEVFNSVHISDAQMAVDYFESHVNKGLMRIKIRTELRGKDLACWCKIYDKNGLRVPCHADILLSIANDIPLKEICAPSITPS